MSALVGSLPRKLVFGAVLLALIVACAAAAPLIAPADPNHQDVLEALQSPSGAHLLGTDALGRDVLSRIIYAGRIDLPVGFAAALLPMLLGSTIGALAGFFGGLFDAGTSAMTSLVQAFPIYVLLIALTFALGAGVGAILISFTVVGWVVYARLLRGEILRIRQADYVQAALVGGLPTRRVLLRHVLPNAYRQSVVYLAGDVVLAIGTFSALAYFGLGFNGESAEWGSMINDGQAFIQQQWWLSAAPGAAIMLVGLALVLIADGLEERLAS